jgi:hypothetical protein
MTELAMLEAELTFHTEAEGGRRIPPGVLTGLQYRPHIVLGDAIHNRGLVARDVVAREEYIGVAFVEGPHDVSASEACTVRMALVYWPNYDYPTVKPGAAFTLREGGRIVGHGHIKRRWVEQYDGAG